MPYTVPTATQFRSRFPRFAAVDSDCIEANIADAARNVDETWFEDDYQPAIMFLAAHLLVMEGALGGAIDTPGLITSEKLGDASVTYGNAVADSKNISDYGSTNYGRRYQELLRKNVPAVLVV